MRKKHPYTSIHTSKGVSLLEMTVVIVIIAFISGAIVAAKTLMTQAKFKSLMTDIERYTDAIETFKDKYHSLPGDMHDAEDYWGSDASCPNTPHNTVPKIATCNGDGDGMVDIVAGSSPNVAETWRAWQHLANAELIDGTYTGVSGPVVYYHCVNNVNAPEGSLENCWYLAYEAIPNGNAGIYPYTGHVINIMKADQATGGIATTMTGEEAKLFDEKFDDGKPGTGDIITWKPSVIDCASTDDEDTAEYVTSDDTIRCALKIVTDL